MSLTLSDIRTRAKRLLQDTNDNNRRWPDAELNDYIFDAQHEFIRLTGFPLHTTGVNLSGLTAEYNMPSTLMTLKRARVRNRAVEIPIISPAVLDESIVFLNEPVDSDWKAQKGPIRALVLEHQSAPTFRLYPIPSGTIYTEVSATLNSTTTITVAAGQTVTVGMVVSGTGIPTGTYVANVSGTTITLTNAATVSGTQTLTFVSTNIFSPQLLQIPTTDINDISGTDISYDASGVLLGTAVTLPSIELQGVRQSYRTSLGTTDRAMTGTFSGSSTSITVTSTATLAIGMYVFGVGIPAGTTIRALPDATTITLSGNTSSAGTNVALTFAADSDTPLIGLSYQESLVYGCVERAYLKENELRNVQKSEEFRRRFLEYVADARRTEPENRIRRVGGANRVRMKLSSRWI